ncbi:unnamed protein product [Oreochromis niloticus]|nr:unnamed protein product [Mustela putorius furo]
MMQLYGALILCVTLSAVCGLRCYTCYGVDPKSCMESKPCAATLNRCFSLRIMPGSHCVDMASKGCVNSAACGGAMACCAGDLCNSTIPTGPSALLLLVSSAILKFLF